ncbi:winged helix-turn-helix transcriptional regulator [candidate division WWE3 bacterium]|uniref:Winged helix-turn-helix transcriptional regulator n=1 Tax=candidate division WWE3 bacterium TaxID=2053526 RepID=A0A955LJZ0_UNCKA|nr:winged helix-turn-helix transcriptional regulator [candidate division WWE3 bacterium]
MQRELKYPKWYHYDIYESLKGRIFSSESFSIAGLPGSGRTAALRVLCFNKGIQAEHFPNHKVLFVFSDTRGLGSVEERDYYRILYDDLLTAMGLPPDTSGNVDAYQTLSKLRASLSKAVSEYDRVVFACNRFFVLGGDLARVQLQLSLLRDAFKDSVVFIISLEHPQQEVNQDTEKALHPLATSTYFMPLLSHDEMERSLKLYLGFYSLNAPKDRLGVIAELSGGHPGLANLLLRLFARSPVASKASVGQLLQEPTLVNELERITRYFTDEQRSHLVRLAQVSDVSELWPTVSEDRVLVETGLVNKEAGVAIPLLKRYLVGSVHVPNARFDINGGRVFLDSKELEGLSLTEFRIIEHLVRNTGKIVTRDELAAIISPDSEGAGVSNESIDQYISRLRKKISLISDGEIIKTVFGRGYMVD